MTIDEYINQDIFNPKYLFHGSSNKINVLEPRQSKDNENKYNEDNAVFLTSSFLTATAYSFRGKLKEVNEKYDFSINNKGEYPVMEFEVDKVPDNLYGYVYVFENNNDIIKDNKEETTQYRSYKKLKPIDIIKVNYRNYENYYKKTNINKSKQR